MRTVRDRAHTPDRANWSPEDGEGERDGPYRGERVQGVGNGPVLYGKAEAIRRKCT